MSTYTNKEEQIAKFAKAMGHPARVAIISLLLKKSTCICGDIVEELPLSQSTVSQHLKELKTSGLIQGTIEGVSVCYCIDPKNWKLLERYLGTFLSAYKGPTTCC